MSNDVPKTMLAAAIDRFGGPEVLKLERLFVPEIDPDEVLIAVHTAGVGPWDADIRGGWYPRGQPDFPLVLGVDGSGTVAAVGGRVRRFKPGDQVYSYSWDNPKGGFYAEYVAVNVDKVAHIPQVLDLFYAGGAAVTGLTALQGIDDHLQIDRGESIIIHGASGGVGTLGVQFAKLRRALIFAVASGEDGKALVRRLGANRAVDGHSDVDIAEEAEHFHPGGHDAVLGLAGGMALGRSVDALKEGGRFAYPNGVEPPRRERPDIRIMPYDAVSGVEEFKRLNRAIDDAELEVPIAASFPLKEAALAHERLAQGHVLGKIVLRVSQGQ